MSPYTSITIIYNPISTGPGETLARELEAKLNQALPQTAVSLTPTEYARHAETLAYDIATASPRPLIISASGDGGYNELINGLIKARRDGARPVAGLLPAGNANDHFRNVAGGDIAGDIIAGKTRHIDLLKLTTTSDGRRFERYAHSYIGLGLTPKVGRELNKTQLNRLNEIWIILKVLARLRSTRLIVNGKIHHYDSLIFSNVATMSKVLSLSEQAALDDGKFEVTAFRRRNRLKLIASLLQATTLGLKGDRQTDEFAFQTPKSALIQLDGEVHTIDAGSRVTINIEPTILECVA